MLESQIDETKATIEGTTTTTISGENGANRFELDESDWQKKTFHTIKKIHVEDLGNMNAKELQESIPMDDSDGRGMLDLQNLEKKLSVKVVFDHVTGHVLLVGDEKKLEKKVFVIRNMISHYHWRLSGKDVAFDKATGKTTASR